MKITVTVTQYDVLEWAVEIDGMLWAAGDCTSVEDGERQALRALRDAAAQDAEVREYERAAEVSP